MAGRISPPELALDASAYRFAVVCARFHQQITMRLAEGARSCLAQHGATTFDIDWVPGAFELPVAAQALADRGDVDAVIALGCVIRGDTPHFDYICTEAARGLMDVMLGTGVPVAFGVLTTDTVEQADERAGGSAGNKGWDAALSAIEMAMLLGRLERGDGAEA